MKCFLRFFLFLSVSGLFFTIWPQPPGFGSGKPAADSSQHIAGVIVRSEIPVLVDFWAPWCAPCRLMAPMLKELEKEFEGKVLFMKVNVDVNKSIAAYFGVNSIPNVFIVKDKIVVNSIPGLQSKDVYAAVLKEVLAAPFLNPPAPEKKPDK